jgi:hypothetical protein
MDGENAALARCFLGKCPDRIDDIRGNRCRRKQGPAAIDLKA